MPQDGNEDEDESSALDFDSLKLIEESLIRVALSDEIPDPPDYGMDYPGHEDDLDMDQEEYSRMIAHFSMVRLAIEIEHQLDEIEESITDEYDPDDSISDSLEDEIKIEKIGSVGNQLIEYFTLISIFIESLSVEILEKELINEEYSGSNKTTNLLQHRMDQGMREDILLRTGIIDESLKSEMNHVRTIRNKLVHNFAHRILLDGFDNIHSDIDRAFDVHRRLKEKVAGDDTVSISVRKNIKK